jgi:hypothetical protein
MQLSLGDELGNRVNVCIGFFLRKTSNLRFFSLHPAKNIDILMSKT